MSVMRSALLWASENEWIERQFRSRSFSRRAVSRFMPGEDPDQALDAAAELERRDMTTVLTALGENVQSQEGARAAAGGYLDVLGRIHERGLPTQISVKLTHLGLDVSVDETRSILSELATEAARLGNFVWVDIEASQYVDTTLDVYARAREEHENVGLCLQAYLYRTEQDLPYLLERGARIRLVKGAYQEPPEVAYPRKRDVDHAYLRLAETLLRRSAKHADQQPAMATHDMRLLARIREMGADLRLGDGAFEVQMLYGIRAGEQLALRRSGLPVRVLISYGSAWFPWYMRRLAERPANVGFVVRSMISR